MVMDTDAFGKRVERRRAIRRRAINIVAMRPNYMRVGGSRMRGGCGETFQMGCGGQGFVLVQPSEGPLGGPAASGGGSGGSGGLLGALGG